MIVPQRINKGLKEFFKIEAASGILLGLSAILALIVANSPFSSVYFFILESKFFGLTIRHWINDGLMAIFFFMVGLEIKKELVLGHLSSPRKAALPMAAACGGMVLPAFIYSFFNQNPPELNGWGIPMATDIAFAVGVLVLFGKRVPLALKVFLLAVAIVDDLGAILVIAFFYTQEIKGAGLGVAFAALGMAGVLRYTGIRSYMIYMGVGVVVWAGFLYSGVHATIAGVLLGLLTPTKFPKIKQLSETYSPLEELVHFLHPWVSFAIMPVFAFANAGIDLRGVNLGGVIAHPINYGIVAGLVLGKPIGIFMACYASIKLGFASLPQGLKWTDIIGVGFLAGIGFTMSLFISGLALSSDLEIYSKTGITMASVLSGIIGSIILYFSLKKSMHD